MIDLTQATELNEEVIEEIRYHFVHHDWDKSQKEKGLQIKMVLELAFRHFIAHLEPSPIRTRALNCIIEALMLGNRAITHQGRS